VRTATTGRKLGGVAGTGALRGQELRRGELLSRLNQAIERAELHHPDEAPAVAVAYAVLGGAMVGQGRFEEARRWLGRAERLLQPGAEPGSGIHRTRYASLISEIVDLLACPGSPEPAPRDRARPHEPLTGGETRVLRYLPTHLCAPDIARELDLSVSTVKTHMRHLYQKLGAHSRREAVERARAFGLLALWLSATSTGAPAHSADPRQLDHDEVRK
jgi:DNA-binding CsgD family transcriptional regulator